MEVSWNLLKVNALLTESEGFRFKSHLYAWRVFDTLSTSKTAGDFWVEYMVLEIQFHSLNLALFDRICKNFERNKSHVGSGVQDESSI